MKNTIESVKEIVTDLSEWVKLSFYALFAWLNIDVQVFTILIAFMCVDSVVGAIKSIRLGREFSFKKMLLGFSLKLCFLIIPLLVALLGKGLGQNFEIGVDVVMKILIVSEAYSVFGNIYSAKNKVEVKRLDVISMLLKSIRIGLRQMLDKSLAVLENAGNCKISDEDKNQNEEK